MEGQLTSSSDASTSSLERALSLERGPSSLERGPSAPELWLGRCATDEMLSSPAKLIPSIALPASPSERVHAERASGGSGGSGSVSAAGCKSEARSGRELPDEGGGTAGCGLLHSAAWSPHSSGCSLTTHHAASPRNRPGTMHGTCCTQ